MQLNDTTNFKGIAQIYEKEIGVDRGFITGNTNRLKDFTADVNVALDDYFAIGIQASGTWQLGDSNHTADYSIIYADITASRNDYPFTTDETGNLILDIYRVAILPSATDTEYVEIFPSDVQSGGDLDLLRETTTTAIPQYYDKTDNAIFLSPTPSYSATKGLKAYINREANYFVSTDTTKMPGVPGLHHKYFALKPALEYARRNGLSQVARLDVEVTRMEASIVEHFGKRTKDEDSSIGIKRIIYR